LYGARPCVLVLHQGVVCGVRGRARVCGCAGAWAFIKWERVRTWRISVHADLGSVQAMSWRAEKSEASD
jgi:hypothetical protein